MTTPLTVYLSNQNSTVLTITGTQLYVTSGTPSTTQFTTTISTSTGFFQILPKGGTGTALGSLPAPNGKGWILDATTLENNQFPNGYWSGTVRFLAMQGTAAGGSVVGDIYVRISDYSSTGSTYTTIATLVLTGQTIPATNTVFTLPQVTGLVTNFATGDKLFIDIYVNVTTNANGMTNQGIRISSISTDTTTFTGSSNASIVSPGYQSSSTVTTTLTPIDTGTNTGNGSETTLQTPVYFTDSADDGPLLGFIPTPSETIATTDIYQVADSRSKVGTNNLSEAYAQDTSFFASTSENNGSSYQEIAIPTQNDASTLSDLTTLSSGMTPTNNTSTPDTYLYIDSISKTSNGNLSESITPTSLLINVDSIPSGDNELQASIPTIADGTQDATQQTYTEVYSTPDSTSNPDAAQLGIILSELGTSSNPDSVTLATVPTISTTEKLSSAMLQISGMTPTTVNGPLDTYTSVLLFSLTENSLYTDTINALVPLTISDVAGSNTSVLQQISGMLPLDVSSSPDSLVATLLGSYSILESSTESGVIGAIPSIAESLSSTETTQQISSMMPTNSTSTPDTVLIASGMTHGDATPINDITAYIMGVLGPAITELGAESVAISVYTTLIASSQNTSSDTVQLGLLIVVNEATPHLDSVRGNTFPTLVSQNTASDSVIPATVQQSATTESLSSAMLQTSIPSPGDFTPQTENSSNLPIYQLTDIIAELNSINVVRSIQLFDSNASLDTLKNALASYYATIHFQVTADTAIFTIED